MQLYLFTHVFNFIEKWTKDPSVWARLRRRHQCLSQLDESDERCHWFDRTTESVDSCRIFAPMVTYSREKQEISIWQLTVYVYRHPSVSDTCGRLHTAVSLHTGLTILRWEKRHMRVGIIFEDVISAYLNWKNLMKDVTDLIGQLEALTIVKHSPRHDF